MRLMHLEAGKNFYGGALQVYYLLRQLHKTDIENLLVCPCDSEIATRARDIAQVVECRMGGDLDILFLPRLVRIIKKYQPDVLHVHSRRGADFWGLVAGRLTGTKVLLTRRVDNTEASFLAQFKAKYSIKIVSISEQIRKVLIDEGIPPEHVVTIRSAVDTQAFRASERNTQIRSRFGYGEEHLLIAVIAQLIDRKGHRDLIRVIPQLIKDFPKARFIFFGKGHKESQLRNEVAKLNVKQYVHFAGFQTDMEAILPNIDIVVHPALKEGLGVSLLQASACGVPIVGTRAGGIPEILKNGLNGYLVPPADSTEIFEKTKILLADRKLRQRFGQLGREWVEKEFSIERMASEYLQLYELLFSSE